MVNEGSTRRQQSSASTDTIAGIEIGTGTLASPLIAAEIEDLSDEALFALYREVAERCGSQFDEQDYDTVVGVIASRFEQREAEGRLHRHAELSVTAEGISVSLYRGDDLVDETWQSWAELGVLPVDHEQVPEAVADQYEDGRFIGSFSLGVEE